MDRDLTTAPGRRADKEIENSSSAGATSSAGRKRASVKRKRGKNP